MLNLISLAPTSITSIFDVLLRLPFQDKVIGQLDFRSDCTFLAKRNQKHLYRKSNSLGMNLELLERFPVHWVVIIYCGEKLVTSKDYLLHFGRIHSFEKTGFEKQVFLPLDQWGVEKAMKYEQSIQSQLDLPLAA